MIKAWNLAQVYVKVPSWNSEVVTSLKIMRAVAILEKWRTKMVLCPYLTNWKWYVKNPNTKIVVRLFLYNKSSASFSHKRIIIDAILEKLNLFDE